MVSMREHITEDQLEAFKKHLKKGYFNALIKPKALNKYVFELVKWSLKERFVTI